MRSSLKFFLLIYSACILFAGCNKSNSTLGLKNNSDYSQKEVVSTWYSQKEFVQDNFNYPEAEYFLPENFFPWAGTVSHHQITDKLIDDWFNQISKCRNVKNFIVICPSHFGLSTQEYSVADCRWNCGDLGVVDSNFSLAEEIRKKLDVTVDKDVFFVEHGASTIMPALKKYFPEAKVVVIAVKGEPPVDMNYVQKLSDCLSFLFTSEQKKLNFLLISTDFAHHGTEEQIAVKDERSKLFFETPKQENFLACGCDNRPGIFVLSSFLEPFSKAYILYHTNSFEISGMDETDITSYFFSLFD